jgi:hypothetical protein
MNTKTISIIGAATGLATFLAVGLLPALLYGGYAGVLLATGIFGAPLHATLAVRAFVVGGMLFGVASVASLFAVLGAVAGTVVGVLVEPRKAAAKPEDEVVAQRE